MTFPGGGSANMGTVTGKVRIDYETSNVRVALRDLDDLQGALADMGAGATQGAREVERAGGVITQFGKVLDRLADHQVPNPVAGMGARVESERVELLRPCPRCNTRLLVVSVPTPTSKSRPSQLSAFCTA